MLGLLRTKRWAGFTVTVIVAIIAFGLLSMWQWHRADQKRAQRVELQTAIAAPPVPIAAVALPAGGGITAVDEWRHVFVTGTYDPASQVLVRKRPLDARNGFWVMAALREDSGRTVWINRGWLAASGDALSTPTTPKPLAGQVSVSGFLRPFEAADARSNEGLPAGQIAAAGPGALPAASLEFPGYVQLETSTPAQDGLVPLPLPTVDESRNVSYAVQWLLFAAVAIGGWFFFLRREAKEDAAAAGATRADVTPSPAA
ncbi:MAG: SURF1 family protein [Actinomycetes bacterium]